MIGFAMCGSFCTHQASVRQLRRLIELEKSVVPIVSETVYSTNTRFGSCDTLRESLENLCGRPVIHTITEAEPLGPKTPLDALIICPCTGNTLAKMACGITDTTVTMAAKAHLRSNRPLIIALASNDALSANLKNIGTLLTKKSVFFVPLTQDDPQEKPHSLVADFDCLIPTLEQAMNGKQYQKIFR